jgi:dolichol-phosphate mannosyltransferase
MDDSSRLIPAVVRCGLEHKCPEFVNPNTSRDFVYVDDACEAFLDAALNLRPDFYGESFNIGTGQKTTIGDIAEIPLRSSKSTLLLNSPWRVGTGI